MNEEFKEYIEREREELSGEFCRGHGISKPEEDSMFDAWGGGIRKLCERGFINYVAQEKKAYCLSPAFTPIPDERAKLEISHRYFTNFSPVTIHDAMYFLGAKQLEVKAWLSELPVKSVKCESKAYYYIENGKDAREMLDYGTDPLAGDAHDGLELRTLSAFKLPYEKIAAVMFLTSASIPTTSVQIAWKAKVLSSAPR